MVVYIRFLLRLRYQKKIILFNKNKYIYFKNCEIETFFWDVKNSL